MKKYLLRVLFALLCTAIAILPLQFKTETTKHPFANEIRWRHAFDENKNTIFIFFNTNGEICRLPYNSVNIGYTFQHDFSLNRQYAAVISGRDSFDVGGNLYRVDGDGCRFVADNVFHGLISDDGKTLAYIRYNEDGITGSLYLYDHTNGSAHLIDDAVSVSHKNARFAISPDGGTVVYCRVEGEDFIGIVWSEGKTITLGRNVYPIAASDGMEHLYYAEPTDVDDPKSKHNLFLQRNGEEIFLDTISAGKHVYFNNDFTEIFSYRPNVIIADANGVHTLSHSPHDIAEPYVNFYYESQFNPYRTYTESYTRQIIDSYKQLRIYTGDGIYQINDDYSCTCIMAFPDTDEPPDTERFQLSSIDNSLLYLKGTALYYRSGSDDRKILEDVANFTASPDLSEVYCQTVDGKLYYVELSSGKHRLVAENISLSRVTPYNSEINTKSWYYMYYSRGIFTDGKCFFVDEAEQTLYYSQKGRTPCEVLSIDSGYLWFCWLGDKLLIANSYPTEDGLNAVRYYLFEGNSAVPFAAAEAEVHYIGHL